MQLLKSPRSIGSSVTSRCFYLRYSFSPSPVFSTRLHRLLTLILFKSLGSLNICPQDLYLLNASIGQRHKMCRLSSSSSPHNRHSLCSVSLRLYRCALRAMCPVRRLMLSLSLLLLIASSSRVLLCSGRSIRSLALRQP